MPAEAGIQNSLKDWIPNRVALVRNDNIGIATPSLWKRGIEGALP